MKKVLLAVIVSLLTLTANAQLVPLDYEGRDSAYVEILLNDIHAKYDKSQQDALQAELYKHHFELASALAIYLNEEQIDAVKDGMTFGRLKRDYQATQDMIPALSDYEKQQILIWLKEAREYAMDAADSKGKHFWFDKYRGRTNNWLSSRGYDLKKERDAWMKRIEEQKTKQKK